MLSPVGRDYLAAEWAGDSLSTMSLLVFEKYVADQRKINRSVSNCVIFSKAKIQFKNMLWNFALSLLLVFGMSAPSLPNIGRVWILHCCCISPPMMTPSGLSASFNYSSMLQIMWGVVWKTKCASSPPISISRPGYPSTSEPVPSVGQLHMENICLVVLENSTVLGSFCITPKSWSIGVLKWDHPSSYLPCCFKLIFHS